MFNLCFTSEASASILWDDRKRVTNINNETTVSRWIDITTSNDSSSRSRRVVTTCQHFQPASPPPVSSQIHDFFLSPSPPEISKSLVDFSHDGSPRTRWVVTTRQHFQPASRPPVSSQIHDFFLSPSPPDIPKVGSTFPMTARHELDGSSRPDNIFSRPHRLQYLHKYTIFS